MGVDINAIRNRREARKERDEKDEIAAGAVALDSDADVRPLDNWVRSTFSNPDDFVSAAREGLRRADKNQDGKMSGIELEILFEKAGIQPHPETQKTINFLKAHPEQGLDIEQQLAFAKDRIYNGAVTNPQHAKFRDSDTQTLPNSFNIDSTIDKVEDMMRSADKGKFLGFGKDGELDGKEIADLFDKISRENGVQIPDELKQTFSGLTNNPDVKVNIDETIGNLRNSLNNFDTNRDGSISPTEMQTAVSAMQEQLASR